MRHYRAVEVSPRTYQIEISRPRWWPFRRWLGAGSEYGPVARSNLISAQVLIAELIEQDNHVVVEYPWRP